MFIYLGQNFQSTLFWLKFWIKLDNLVQYTELESNQNNKVNTGWL